MSLATIGLMVATMVGLAVADFSIKQSTGRISPAVGTLLYAVAALAFSVGWTIVTAVRGEVLLTRDGALWSAVSGLAFSAVTGLLFLVFGTGVSLSTAIPTIRTGGLLLAAALGFVVLGERLTWQYAIGFVLALAGIGLVATSQAS